MGELPGFPVLGGVDGNQVFIRGTKDRMQCGTFGGRGSASLIAAFERDLPPMVPATTMDVSLSNSNHVVHPTVVLANMADVDAGRQLLFYRDGITPAVGEMVLAVDRERLAVGAAAGLSLRSVPELFGDFYLDMSGDTLVEMLRSFPAFATSLAPTSLAHRFLELRPAGLAP